MIASLDVDVTIHPMAAEQTASNLQTCPACGTEIDTSSVEPLARVACPNCGEQFRVERMFDNFLLLETLGLGGMGTVYKARDTLLDRLVALKLLRKDLEGGFDQAALLQQEARVAASVNHPNVVQVFSSGTDHGQFYLVMELVECGSLDDFIEQQKRVPEEQVLETGIQVAKGLRAAQAKGLIHRDVKPANILFADEHTAKIGDFGLAGVAAEAHGEIWGTPYYVAPERLNNQPEDFRSDMYSLGATLFHAIAGKAPIEGETNSASELRELKKEPLLLSIVAPDVSPATARIFNRMIAPDPAHRFGSYDELVTELEAAYKKLTGKEVIDVATAKRKTRRIITAAATVLIAVAVGVFLYVRKTEKQIAISSTAIPLPELEKQSADARHQLVLNHHNVASAAFVRIATEARNRQPLADWARLQQGLAAIVGRDEGQANDAFRTVQKNGENGFPKEDDELATFFTSTANAMLATGPPTSNERQPGDKNSFDAFDLLLFGLKDIERRDVKTAMQLLEEFTKSRPAGKFTWIADFKPLAQKYLDDCRVYLNWKKEIGEQGKSAFTADRLRAVRKQMKTHTAMSDEISASEKNFGAAGEAQAETTPQSPPTSSRDAAKNNAQWMLDWKNMLISDLNHKQFSGSITDVTGAEYTGIAGADNQTVTLKLPYGVARLPWSRISPKSLLAVSRSFIQANAADAADRQWLCAAFAASSGQKEAARELAEAAADAQPEYRDRISVLLPQ